jgi:tetratricopeptide (TPR) repeat protein
MFDSLGLPVEAGMAVAVHARALISSGDNAAAIEVTQPRWTALDHVHGAEPALLHLAGALGSALSGRGEHDAAAAYADRRMLLAEALDDPDSLAHAHVQLGNRYMTVGAPISAGGLFKTAATIAREHGLLGRLALSLNNLATLQISRDLTAALESGREGVDAARRSGVRNQIDYTTVNYLMALWTAGRLVDARAMLAEAHESVVDPSIRITLTSVEVWLADAQGLPLPASPDTAPTDNETALAWLGNLDLMHALAAGDTVGAAGIAERSITHLLTASGIEDDFMHLWPPLVQAALAAGDTDLAQRLLEPVSSAAPGIVSAAVAAHWHRLRGLLGAARGDDPDQVETELRAGVAALDAFGAIGHRACAQQELARWLVEQNRPGDAELLIEQARATYIDIEATGWLTQLDAWQAERMGSRT